MNLYSRFVVWFRTTRLGQSELVHHVYRNTIRLIVKKRARQPIDFRGFTISVSPTDPTISPGVIFGYYERFTLDLIQDLVKPGSIVIDVGANIGIYSLATARCASPGGFVLAVEPEPSNLGLLRKNLIANETSNVIVEESAVTDSPGSALLQIYLNNSGNHRLTRAGVGEPVSESKQLDVLGVTLAALIAKHSITHIDLIKIDIEGFEPVALSTVPHISSMCSAMLIEYVPEHLVEAGFDPQTFLNQLLSQWPFVARIDERTRQLHRVRQTTDIDPRFDGNLLCLANADAHARLVIAFSEEHS